MGTVLAEVMYCCVALSLRSSCILNDDRPAATLFFFDIDSSGPNVCAATFVRQNLDGEAIS